MLGMGFRVDGVWGQWYEALWFFWGLESLYNHRTITLGIKMVMVLLGKQDKCTGSMLPKDTAQYPVVSFYVKL